MSGISFPACSLIAAATGLLLSCSSPPPAAPLAASTPREFGRATVAKGAQLAAIGNCVTCHTAHGGKPFAGGYALKTPFGTVYGTNITPDPQTGIGGWSEAEFARAMREGLDREGRHLYPVFPYDYFTRLTDDDIRALYAYLMTREPVQATPSANRMLVPRFAIAFWKARHFDRSAFRPDPKQGAQWNRGAYLVEALAHCSACHTPRDKLGVERKDRYMSGGEVGGWHAPALNEESPSPVPWNAETLSGYLRTGLVDAHAIAAGPMAPVVRTLAHAAQGDSSAIAVYIASLDARSRQQHERLSREALARPPARGPDTRDLASGAVVYAGACGDCHNRGREAEGGALPLPLAIGLTIPTPRNLIHIVRDGIIPNEHEAYPWMPPFAGVLTDEQVADLVIYLRTLANKPAWQDVPAEVRRVARGDE